METPISEFDTKIICPVCKNTYVHIGNAVNKDGQDNYKAWVGRADSIEIPMWCESDHKWIMVIGHHKGNTYTFNKSIEKIELLEKLAPVLVSIE